MTAIQPPLDAPVPAANPTPRTAVAAETEPAATPHPAVPRVAESSPLCRLIPAGPVHAKAPFRTISAPAGRLEARVSGELPNWLRGELVRTCPSVLATERWRAAHWFDGLCRLVGLHFSGSSVQVRHTLLDSDAARAAADGKSPMATFAGQITRGPLRRLLQPTPQITDNANVNVISAGPDQLLTLTEGSRPILVDRDTFGRVGHFEPRDALFGWPTTAHPHFDRARGRLIDLAIGLRARPEIALYERDASGGPRTVIARHRCAQVPYVHAFGLTPSAALIIDHPLRARPSRMLWSNRGFIDHFVWDPAHTTRVVALDRGGGAEKVWETEVMFIFHIANAFDDGSDHVLDVIAYPDAAVIDGLRAAALLDAPRTFAGELVRLRLPRGAAAARIERTGVPMEFPRIDYAAHNGQRYDRVYGARAHTEDGVQWNAAIVAFDWERGRTREFSAPGWIFGEPVFVRAPSRPPGHGVVLTIASHADAPRSAAFVLDAQTLEERGRVDIDAAIPLGFHGNFFADHKARGSERA